MLLYKILLYITKYCYILQNAAIQNTVIYYKILLYITKCW